MARKFRELMEAMPAERRARVNAETARLEAEMRLRELRNSRDLSQADLADALDTDQGNVSRLERQADMYVSTLRRYLEALGGTLEIVAHFPDRDVRITQFRELRRSSSR
jgi:transcriptional regulator with XRE-family HTH domain